MAERLLLWQAFAKLQWGGTLVANLEKAFSEYIELPAIKQVVSQEPNTGDYVAWLYAEPMHLAVSHLTGGAIHQFRSALDTAVSTIVEAAGLKTGRTYFPMFKEEETFRASFAISEKACPDCKAVRQKKGTNYQIRESLPELEKILSDIQPWETGNFPLWALGRLDNAQKHQLLVPIIGKITHRGPGVFGDSVHINNSIRLQPGGSFIIMRSQTPIEIFGDPICTGVLEFQETLPLGGKEVVPTLYQLFGIVQGALETLETYFRASQFGPD